MADSDRGERLRQVAEADADSRRLWARLGLSEGNEREAQVRDWLTSWGAVPTTVACAALVLYLVLVVVWGLL